MQVESEDREEIEEVQEEHDVERNCSKGWCLQTGFEPAEGLEKIAWGWRDCGQSSTFVHLMLMLFPFSVWLPRKLGYMLFPLLLL